MRVGQYVEKAYRVAKHYGVSLLEVYSMSPAIFKQSLAWALVVEEEQVKQQEVAKQKAKSNGNETVRLDYSFWIRRTFDGRFGSITRCGFGRIINVE